VRCAAPDALVSSCRLERMDENYHLQTGQVLARYQIVRTIGEGGMGTVYEAFHPGLKKRFAIKTLLASIAQIPEARARFLREAEVAARINHPNVVRVTDVGTDGEMPYMVMEFLEGLTLGSLLATRGHLEIIETMDIILPVISAVAAGHAQGIVHRDLKPENIFLTQGSWGDLSPKVLDFGVSKLIGDASSVALTGTMTVLGTAAYMSPEQARGARAVDHRSDQYALGLIVYEMLTGTRGHPGENPFEVLHNIATRAIAPPREYRPDCPPALEEIVMCMLAPAPEQRFPSLLEVGAALLAFASDKVRLTMGDAFRHHSPTAVLPAVESSVGSQGPARPPLDAIGAGRWHQAASHRGGPAGGSQPTTPKRRFDHRSGNTRLACASAFDRRDRSRHRSPRCCRLGLAAQSIAGRPCQDHRHVTPRSGRAARARSPAHQNHRRHGDPIGSSSVSRQRHTGERPSSHHRAGRSRVSRPSGLGAGVPDQDDFAWA